MPLRGAGAVGLAAGSRCAAAPFPAAAPPPPCPGGVSRWRRTSPVCAGRGPRPGVARPGWDGARAGAPPSPGQPRMATQTSRDSCSQTKNTHPMRSAAQRSARSPSLDRSSASSFCWCSPSSPNSSCFSPRRKMLAEKSAFRGPRRDIVKNEQAQWDRMLHARMLYAWNPPVPMLVGLAAWGCGPGPDRVRGPGVSCRGDTVAHGAPRPRAGCDTRRSHRVDAVPITAFHAHLRSGIPPWSDLLSWIEWARAWSRRLLTRSPSASHTMI